MNHIHEWQHYPPCRETHCLQCGLLRPCLCDEYREEDRRAEAEPDPFVYQYELGEDR